MRTILVNLGMLATIGGLVYLAVVMADTSNEKWLCALMSLVVSLNLTYDGDDDD
jgi:hypothetical protein